MSDAEIDYTTTGQRGRPRRVIASPCCGALWDQEFSAGGLVVAACPRCNTRWYVNRYAAYGPEQARALIRAGLRMKEL